MTSISNGFSTIYWGIWTAFFLAWGTLSYQFVQQLSSYHHSLGMKIRSFNARNGIDQSVDKERLALDLMVPFRSRYLEQCAINNGWEFNIYRQQLREQVGQTRIWLAILVHLSGLGFHLLGLLYLFPTRLLSYTGFIIADSLLFASSFGLYWVVAKTNLI